MQGKNLVVKVSGSVFNVAEPRSALERVSVVSSQLKSLRSLGFRIVVVAGGGPVSRAYINVGRALGLDEGTLDQIGIYVTRANASLLATCLGEYAHPLVPETLNELLTYYESSEKIIVAGGLHPGHSTNAVAALIAERVRADLLVNATDVEGVYNKDPRENPDAKLRKEIHIDDLEKLVAESSGYRAGTYRLMDLVSVKILKRSKIPTIITRYDKILESVKTKGVGTRIIY